MDKTDPIKHLTFSYKNAASITRRAEEFFNNEDVKTYMAQFDKNKDESKKRAI